MLLQAFPKDYDEAIQGTQAATKAAIADGKLLLEIEFPTAGLASVAGDAEGQNEMTYSLEFLRRFLVYFQVTDGAASTRVFFPDKQVRSLAPCRSVRRPPHYVLRTIGMMSRRWRSQSAA